MARSTGLDQATVVHAAADLADQHGLDQLTLAQLAAHLEIRTPSLYNHIDGLPGLRRELALLGLHQLAECKGRAAMGVAGEAAVRAVTQAYREYVHQHPGLYAATLRAPDPTDAELQQAAKRVVEIILAALAAYNLADEDALHAVRGLRSIVHGFATLELAGGFGMPLDRDESFRRLVQIFIGGLRTQTLQ